MYITLSDLIHPTKESRNVYDYDQAVYRNTSRESFVILAQLAFLFAVFALSFHPNSTRIFLTLLTGLFLLSGFRLHALFYHQSLQKRHHVFRYPFYYPISKKAIITSKYLATLNFVELQLGFTFFALLPTLFHGKSYLLPIGLVLTAIIPFIVVTYLLHMSLKEE